MKDNDLRRRTKEFALRVIRMYVALPKNDLARVLGSQALRAGTSVGAQYREACRSRSNAEMVSKLESVLQELDEVQYWFELLTESAVVKAERLTELQKETDELIAIFVAGVRKLKSKKRMN
jgi:four helix bundle protein